MLHSAQPSPVGLSTTEALMQAPFALMGLCSEQCRSLLNTDLRPPLQTSLLLKCSARKKSVSIETLHFPAAALEWTGGAGTSGPIPKYIQALPPGCGLLDNGQESKKGTLNGQAHVQVEGNTTAHLGRQA